MAEETPKKNPFVATLRELASEFPFHQFLDYSVEESRQGYARISMPCGPKVDGGVGGSVHGGILASLVDIAMLEAVFPTLEEGDTPGGTIDLGITYLRPTKGSRVVAEANIIRRGRHVINTEVDIKDDQGRLCARGRVLYAVRPSS